MHKNIKNYFKIKKKNEGKNLKLKIIASKIMTAIKDETLKLTNKNTLDKYLY